MGRTTQTHRDIRRYVRYVSVLFDFVFFIEKDTRNRSVTHFDFHFEQVTEKGEELLEIYDMEVFGPYGEHKTYIEWNGEERMFTVHLSDKKRNTVLEDMATDLYFKDDWDFTKVNVHWYCFEIAFKGFIADLLKLEK